ncbi:MAG: SDR family oxidoreductase [Ferruginibacter sp.]
MNVVITGASKGIGKAIAASFAAAGNHLFLCARNEVNLYNTVAALQTEYASAQIKAIPADLSKKNEVIHFAEWVSKNAGTVDILVNNAGSFLPGSIFNEKEGTLENMIETNLYSAYHLTRLLLPEMMKKKQGHIFNICSVASLESYPNGGSYSISKFAMAGFSKNLREEMKPYHIKVSALYPGAVMTDSWGDFDNSAKRIMEAEDVAAMVLAMSRLSVQAVVEDIVMRPQLGDL